MTVPSPRSRPTDWADVATIVAELRAENARLRAALRAIAELADDVVEDNRIRIRARADDALAGPAATENKKG